MEKVYKEEVELALKNCDETLKGCDMIFIQDVSVLLKKALEYKNNKSDLSNWEKANIKEIREMIKGL